MGVVWVPEGLGGCKLGACETKWAQAGACGTRWVPLRSGCPWNPEGKICSTSRSWCLCLGASGRFRSVLQRWPLRKHHGKHLEGAGIQESGMRLGVKAVSIFCGVQKKTEGTSAPAELWALGSYGVASCASQLPWTGWGQVSA